MRFPSKRYAFRESGYKLALEALKIDEDRYRGKWGWRTYIKKQRDFLRIGMGADGITATKVQAAKPWPTLSRYLQAKPGTPLTPHQDFLKKLVFVFWKEYSAMTHAVFQGLMPTAVFYIPGMVQHDLREAFDEVMVGRFVATHVLRSAEILLCTVTEVQAEFRFFDEARINARLLGVWNALRRVPAVRELYVARYEQLMRDRGIV